MPQSILAICGMGILFSSIVYGQSQPATTTQVQFSNQSVQEQKTWHQKQLPMNSVMDQTAYKAPGSFVVANNPPNYFQESVMKEPEEIQGINMTPAQKYELNNLQRYIQQNRAQYLQTLKNSWWKDPSKGIGASILQGFVNDSYHPGKQ